MEDNTVLSPFLVGIIKICSFFLTRLGALVETSPVEKNCLEIKKLREKIVNK